MSADRHKPISRREFLGFLPKLAAAVIVPPVIFEASKAAEQIESGQSVELFGRTDHANREFLLWELRSDNNRKLTAVVVQRAYSNTKSDLTIKDVRPGTYAVTSVANYPNLPLGYQVPFESDKDFTFDNDIKIDVTEDDYGTTRSLVATQKIEQVFTK